MEPASALKCLARQDLCSGGMDFGFHAVEIGRVQHDQWSARGHHFALGIEPSLTASAVERDIVRPVVDKASAEN
jgi:hypothetical protein